MQQSLQYIREQLQDFYPDSEIRSLSYRIVESVFQAGRQTLLRDKDKQLSANDLAQIEKITEELKKYRPLQYILGKTEFYGLPFQVNEQVLIPRPETEELVEWVIEGTRYTVHGTGCIVHRAPCKILDMGTGSGCIAIALAKHLPEAEVYALDISEKALEVAEENAHLNKVNVRFFQYDILAPLPCTPHRAPCTKYRAPSTEYRVPCPPSSFDIIVSNPPYITPSERHTMSPNVLAYEPHQALFTPEEQPLLFYERIADFGQLFLKPGGQLFFETNASFGKAVAELLRQKGYEAVEVRRDISQKERMVAGKRNFHAIHSVSQ